MPTHSINNQPLAKPLRSQLEATVKSARDVAEKGAHAALTTKHLQQVRAELLNVCLNLRGRPIADGHT